MFARGDRAIMIWTVLFGPVDPDSSIFIRMGRMDGEMGFWDAKSLAFSLPCELSEIVIFLRIIRNLNFYMMQREMAFLKRLRAAIPSASMPSVPRKMGIRQKSERCVQSDEYHRATNSRTCH